MDPPLLPLDAYLNLADELMNGRITEANLADLTTHLPPLTEKLLQQLTNCAQEAALKTPKRSWAITAVAAARPTDNDRLAGMAAWQLARAANAWVQPHLVETAVARARDKFAALNEPGWLAACTWQQNALPWTRPDFQAAADALADALTTLEAAGFAEFVPDCRLSLAYANLLIGHFDLAATLTRVSEQTYQARHDPLGQGRCLLTQSSILRRQSNFAAAKACLQKAMPLLQTAPVYAAQAYFQLAHIALASQDHASIAENWFLKALEMFKVAELQLWSAQCLGGLAQLYNQGGQLAKASEALHQAREIYADYEIYGLRADILLDSGRFEMLRGNFESSLDYFGKAQDLYKQTGNEWMPIVCLSNQGQVNIHLGFYQRALHYLERAYRRLQPLGIAYRTADCEKQLALCWVKLGQYSQAHAYLDSATAHYQQADQHKYLYEVYLLRAETLLLEQKMTDAIAFLEKALSIAQVEEANIEIATCHRLLGELLTLLKEQEQAARHLTTAESSFKAMGLTMELASCQITWGNFHYQAGNLAAARTAWENALALNQGVLQDVVWQAYAGLARVAQAEDRADNALKQYGQMIAALTRLRQGLWQPSLAGAFLRQPLPSLDKAITLAAQQVDHPDTLNFIEESKAQTVVWRLRSGQNLPEAPLENSALAEMASEIRWLQGQVTAVFETQPNPNLTTQINLRQQLVRKIAAYDALKSQKEREQLISQPGSALPTSFNLDDFRLLASLKLGQSWLALDYYLSADALCVVMVAPGDYQTWSIPISGQVRLALKLLTGTGAAKNSSTERLMNQLGTWLFPALVQERLTPETTLILSPHSHLHQLPWPALYLNDAPLVSCCIPVVVSSFITLQLLWQRANEPVTKRDGGLLLAVSDFYGRYAPLPAVTQEAEFVAGMLGADGERLVETAATWHNLRALANDSDGLARFPFWHIASHAFHDGLTGRLSGVALYDRDVWLDELWQLAPLPPLVVLSACSGSRSLLFAGDEHVSLTMTCLMAGAQTVVGTLWPLLDEQAPDLVRRFYTLWRAGVSASQALALSQREAFAEKQVTAQWGAFLCIGAP